MLLGGKGKQPSTSLYQCVAISCSRRAEGCRLYLECDTIVRLRFKFAKVLSETLR